MDKIESELGDLKITEQFFERSRSESEFWDEVDGEKLVDKLHLSEVEDLRTQLESSMPYVEVKTKEGWHRVYFVDADAASEFFDRLDYMWKSFMQRED